eukprot:CAMPEP_0202958884 /NCGR_PEP_ID=MMETSP1396-20130829/3159_1 /ASSEMBLY_ACC=CAM_ASM_000872 /TAXON_ID= /ORGANISM="Pseudokeronopsis sp., Strain Brazil" /LENGTH=55 /DNA_ID=CAMNT_0049677187 /DNA_START=954 /DNA_END=1121 /DNA_ORIENTATION=+
MKSYIRKRYHMEDEEEAGMCSKVFDFLFEKPLKFIRNVTVPQMEEDTWHRAEAAI